MDEIQKILIKAGRKDLAQEYYKKTADIGDDWDKYQKVMYGLMESWKKYHQVLEKLDIDKKTKNDIINAWKNLYNIDEKIYKELQGKIHDEQRK